MFDASIRTGSGSGADDTAPVSRLRALWPEALGVATALLVAALYGGAEPCPDVAWQLWIGHQLRHGARFYIDIIEVNPPLWFWMAIPIDWVVQITGSRPGAVLAGAMGLASALSLVATGRLLAPLRAPIRAGLLGYAALVLMLMPLQDMGQREQILLIAALPYIALAAARHERRAIPPWLALAVGIGAALGFALKHYFLITPILLEVWLLAGLRRRYRPFRPETWALGATGLVYAAALLALAPAYLDQIVPMLRLVYGAIGVRHIAAMAHLTQGMWAAMALILLLRPRRLAATPAAAAFAVAALGFAGAWLIQMKGWQYHAIPTTGCLMLALALLCAQRWRSLAPLAWMTAPTVLAAPLLLSAYIGPYRDLLIPAMRPLLTGLGPRDGIAVVSEKEAYAWPLSLRRGVFYPSRHYSMWMFNAVVQSGGTDPAIDRVGRQVVEETAQDYACAQPVRILFDQHDRGGFDMERFFLASPRFAMLLHHYRRIGRYHQFDVFQRIAPFPAPPATACRRGV